jgi:hypothetical protein
VATPEAPRLPDHEPDAAGIALAGSPLRIDFGRAEAGTVAAMTRLEGGAPSAVADCGGGVRSLRWPGGLALVFQGGAFLGWSQPDGSSAGLACGA